MDKDMELSTTKDSLSRYTEPAVIIALGTSVLYLAGTMYFSNFFGCFSLPYENLGLLPTIYIGPLINIITFNIANLIIFYELKKYISYRFFRKFGYKNEEEANLPDLYILIPLLETLFFIFFNNFVIYALLHFQSLFFAISLFLIFFYIFLKNFRLEVLSMNDIKILFRKITGIRDPRAAKYKFNILMYLLLFILLNMSFIQSIAYADASNLIEGGLGSYEIRLDGNGSNPGLPAGTFILIMQREDCFYVVQKCRPAPLHSALYLIPLDKVNYAKVTQETRSGYIQSLLGSVWQSNSSPNFTTSESSAKTGPCVNSSLSSILQNTQPTTKRRMG